MGEPHWVKRFTEWGAPGAYLKVLTPGVVQQGAAVELEFVPDHGVTIGDIFKGRRGDKERLARLLTEPDLSKDLMGYLERELAIGSTQEGS
jgi:MOSC domain-containing protein YiiM